MQVCISLQTDNQASTPPLKFFTGRMPFLPPNQQRQSTEGIIIYYLFINHCINLLTEFRYQCSIWFTSNYLLSFNGAKAFSALTLLVGRQEGHPACKKLEWWGAGMVICLERGADLHIAQLMPLLLSVSCFSKIQIGFTFLVPAHPGSPGKKGP